MTQEKLMWYTLQTRPNYEAKVTEEINKKIKENGAVLPIREIFSPEELIVEFKDGKKKERKKRLYTNYLFLEMDYSDAVWHSLKGIRGVVGFVGNRTNPVVLPEEEVATMKAQVNGEVPKPRVMFAENSRVRITSGSFADFYGVLKSVDYEKNKAKVLVSIFNRETEVDLELNLIEQAK